MRRGGSHQLRVLAGSLRRSRGRNRTPAIARRASFSNHRSGPTRFLWLDGGHQVRRGDSNLRRSSLRKRFPSRWALDLVARNHGPFEARDSPTTTQGPSGSALAASFCRCRAAGLGENGAAGISSTRPGWGTRADRAVVLAPANGAASLRADGGRRTRAADCLRQHRLFDAGSWYGTGEGNGHAARSGRNPRKVDPPTADRMYPAVVGRRTAGNALRSLGQCRAPRLHLHGQGNGILRSLVEPTRSGVHGGSRCADGDFVWCAASISLDARFVNIGHERQPGRGGRHEGAIPPWQVDGRVTDRADTGVAGLGRLVSPEPAETSDAGHRL